MIKNIFFDFNGTLLNDTDLCFDIEEDMLIKEGLNKVTKEFYLDNFSFPVRNYYKLVGFDVSDENYAKLSNFFISNYNAREKEETSLNPGVVEILKKLKSDGYKLYILSASEENLLIKQLKDLKIFDYFDGLAASKNIAAHGKIEYGKQFIKDNCINPNESIMIGDTIHDYEVAVELGLIPILYSKGHNSKKVLKKVNAPIVDSFEEFYKIL